MQHMYSVSHVLQLFAAVMCAVRLRLVATPLQPHSKGADLDSYEWLGRLDVKMGWYLAPLARYWEW